jgi:ABC-type branched-subunit amino acid transport system ATPase component
MLEIKNICKSFDGVKAVNDFSLSASEKKITSLIGPNGAGKTTVFNVVTGFLVPDSGDVLFRGASVAKKPPYKIARKGMTRTFQNLRLFKKLTAFENVMLGRQNQKGERLFDALVSFSKNSPEHRDHVEKAEALLTFVGLHDHRDELAENLSYGQQKLLSIACCLATEPDLLLLDEPVSGVQPAMIEKIVEVIHDLVSNQGKTVLLIEHDIDFVLNISDTVVVMDEGKKIAEGTPSIIKNSPEILEAYLS